MAALTSFPSPSRRRYSDSDREQNRAGSGRNALPKNAQALYGMGQQQAAQAAGSWKCACGTVVNGNFCPNCGAKKPDNDGWTCSCGKVNKGNFCANCGAKKPEGLPKYRCDKCGWEPEDPAHPPKFCPQCGDPFDENDRA